LLAGLGVFVLLVALAMILAGRTRSERPASRAALEQIAAKNREAAVVSAARMKTESDAAAAAADARIAATEIAETDVAEAEAEAGEPAR
jgi:hypothetical protein